MIKWETSGELSYAVCGEYRLNIYLWHPQKVYTGEFYRDKLSVGKTEDCTTSDDAKKDLLKLVSEQIKKDFASQSATIRAFWELSNSGFSLLSDVRKHGEVLIKLADEIRAAQFRAQCLKDPQCLAGPNLCKSCGHLNRPDQRGWCLCEHCGFWMDRGPFPGESLEQHLAKGPVA